MSAELPKLRTKFSEPVVDSGADPYVIIHEDFFYYCHVVNDEAIYIRKAKSLNEIGDAKAVLVWQPPKGQPYTESLWAPELHFLDGKWYIYFAAGKKDHIYTNQRMYVIEGEGDDPQTAKYSYKSKIRDASDQWAIDGTVMSMENGDRYFVWSGWPSSDNIEQRIYIAKMKNPWTLEGERVAISSPVYDWERVRLGTNEGPQILPQGHKRHIIYSASHSLTDNYCLGQLSLIGDNPLDPTHWVKRQKPVFETHSNLISPGHASFILTPDERYGWMIFHSARHPGAQWDRQVRLAAFALLEDGTLNFIKSSRIIGLANPKKLLTLLDKIINKNK